MVSDEEQLERLVRRVAEWRAQPSLRDIAEQEGVSVHILRNIARGYSYKRRPVVDIEQLAQELESGSSG